MNPKRAQVRSVTLHDAASGVAPLTASRALSRKASVRPDLRDRVLASARPLNYRPILAPSVRQQSTRAVGVLPPDMANPFSSEVVQGFESVLLEHGYDGVITASLRNVEREKSALAAFITTG